MESVVKTGRSRRISGGFFAFSLGFRGRFLPLWRRLKHFALWVRLKKEAQANDEPSTSR